MMRLNHTLEPKGFNLALQLLLNNICRIAQPFRGIIYSKFSIYITVGDVPSDLLFKHLLEVRELSISIHGVNGYANPYH